MYNVYIYHKRGIMISLYIMLYTKAWTDGERQKTPVFNNDIRDPTNREELLLLLFLNFSVYLYMYNVLYVPWDTTTTVSYTHIWYYIIMILIPNSGVMIIIIIVITALADDRNITICYLLLLFFLIPLLSPFFSSPQKSDAYNII